MGCGDQVFGVVHFGEGEVEGEDRLGALVFVDAVVVQAVAAAAGGGIVERQAEIVAAEEPLEGALRLARPRSDRGWRGRLRGRRRPWPAPPPAAGRSRPARRPADRSHCCRWAGSGRPGSSGSRPASAGI